MTGREERFLSVRMLMKQFDREPQHALQVTRLALKLFDQLNALHGLGDKERDWLEAAGLLHDIGWSQSANGHHKESQKLILKADLLGWSDEEKLMIANVARYHRKSAPKVSHKLFAVLNESAQAAVAKLAAILRVADGLDRSHHNVVDEITVRLADDAVRLQLHCRYEIGFELYGFEKKRGLFGQVFGREIVVESILPATDTRAAM